jgi:hypothetical protein
MGPSVDFYFVAPLVVAAPSPFPVAALQHDVSEMLSCSHRHHTMSSLSSHRLQFCKSFDARRIKHCLLQASLCS